MIPNPYVWLIAALLLLGTNVVSWFSGEEHGKGLITAQCNVERLANAKAANDQLLAQQHKADLYAKQLEDANVLISALSGRIDAVSRAPLPRVLCYPTAPSGGRGVSADSIKTSDRSAGPDAAGDVRGSDFDPAPVQRSLHTAFANAYAACLDALNRWPN